MSRSWIPVPEGHPFPLENLPYGVFKAEGGAHIGVAIGDSIVDLYECAELGLFDDACDRELLQAPVLNGVLAAGRTTWTALRARLTELLREGGDEALLRNRAQAIVDAAAVTMLLPVEVGDYVDFYSSREHATNLGKMFRPNGEALMPNWKWIPIGYHGRSSTIVVDGTPVVRPNGQRKPPDAEAPVFGASTRLDIELEVGFITGPGNEMGQAIPIADAREHIFGLVLVNDWSARDIQAWEYQPLGPFLGKSFATTISPWLVTLDALEPFRVEGPAHEWEPLPYLRSEQPWNFDIDLEVRLRSREMAERNLEPVVISRTNFRDMYWNAAQQLAHATVNGTAVRPGDLYASGTISGATPDALGSFIELTWNGARPIELPTGEKRSFLADGDEVTLTGWCQRDGKRLLGFGSARGTIRPAAASAVTAPPRA